jgi:hypothetical protein
MNVQAQIDNHIAQPSPRRRVEMQGLHRRAAKGSPGDEPWFLDGRNSTDGAPAGRG